MSSSKSGEVHFLACVHGMWGIPEHVSPLEKTILKRFPKAENGTELVTLRVQTNADSLTYDGLDWGAERAVKEIYQKIEEVEKGGLKRVTKFSIVGYSLGGLISRYAIGILYQRGFFNNVKPMNFNTFATPHIGLPAFRGLIGRAVHRVGPVMLSRTGRQFYGTDNDIWSPGAKEGRPLLEVMSEKDTIFFKALSAFPHMAIYGNAVHDLTVTYCSSMIEPYDPFTKSHRLAIEMDTEYKHVIKKFYEVPEGEEVPMHDLAKELEAQRKSKPWYSPDKYGSGRPPVPPFLQFPFPLNILFYLSAPVLLPAMISFAALRLGRESIGSQKRLAQLAASAESESSLAAMLRKMEMAMADAVDSGGPGVLVRRRSNESEMEEDEATDQGLRKEEMVSQTEVEVRRGASSLPTPALTPSADSLVQPKLAPCTSPDPTDKDQPILTASHLKMIESLNSIPQLEKFRAYHPYVRNAHSVIVARDPGRMFPSDMDAYSVMRHWADRFVL